MRSPDLIGTKVTCQRCHYEWQYEMRCPLCHGETTASKEIDATVIYECIECKVKIIFYGTCPRCKSHASVRKQYEHYFDYGVDFKPLDKHDFVGIVSNCDPCKGDGTN